MYGLKGRELPISRQSCTDTTAAFRSSGCARVLGLTRGGSLGLVPERRISPRLFGATTPALNPQEPIGGANLAAASALQIGSSTWQVCISGLSRLESLFQKKVASAPLLCIGRGCWYSQIHPIAT